MISSANLLSCPKLLQLMILCVYANICIKYNFNQLIFAVSDVNVISAILKQIGSCNPNPHSVCHFLPITVGQKYDISHSKTEWYCPT